MIEELWHALLARGLRVLQVINNIHRQFGLWYFIEHWKAALCALLLFLLALFGGGRLYGRVKQQRLLAHATEALRSGDNRGAAIFARGLLRDDPQNLAALKVIYQATDKGWPRDSLYWHQQLDNVQPGDPANCLAWARTALSLGNPSLARHALDRMRRTDANTADYQWLAGETAFAQRYLQDAVDHLEKAAALSSTRTDYALELAKVRLLLPGDSREKGRQDLEALAANPTLRLQALRMLFRDAVRHNQNARAADYFLLMKKTPGIAPEDRIEFLDFLLRTRSPALTAELRDYKDVVRAPRDVARLVFWMNAHKMSLLAIEWIINLPPEVRADNRVQLALGEAYLTLGDWPHLKALTTDADWRDIDFLRAGLLARALSEEGDTQQAQDQWNLATLKAADNPQSLVRLCAAAIAWGWRWETQAEELAWRVVDSPHPPEAILEALQERFMAEGDTRKLYRLLARRRELEPANTVVLNNFALVSLLLKKNENQAHALAKRAYEGEPTDARKGSTYAFSLYLQGQKTEALNVMSHFGSQLKIPSVALYNGIILAACGDPSQARPYLKLAKQAVLLPEEQQLEVKAEASIGDAPSAAPK